MEKKEYIEELPLLFYRDKRDAIVDNFIRVQEPSRFEEKLYTRHRNQQGDINRYYRGKT